MNFEIVMSYVIMGIIIACVYYIFKIAECGIFTVIKMFRSLMYKPEPNRKRRFKNVNQMSTLINAANEFGFDIYRPIRKDVLKDRFRFKAKTAHPDCGGSDEEFIKVKRYYDILLPHTT